MPTFHYFAYGSNMLAERLQARCPSARPCGVGMLHGFGLTFCKRSIDGSGKAALVTSSDAVPGQTTFGVCYEIDCAERPHLDRAESDGYMRDDGIAVHKWGGGERNAMTSYVGQPAAIDHALVPYDWYMALVIAGARQHALADDYIAWLEDVRTMPDPLTDRPSRLDALAVLRAAGYP